MNRHHRHATRLIRRPAFGLITAAGTLSLSLVQQVADTHGQILFLGALVSILAALVFSLIQYGELHTDQIINRLDSLGATAALADLPEQRDDLLRISRGVIASRDADAPLLADIVARRLAAIAGEADRWTEGQVIFTATETWRTVYETLLQSLGDGTYRSVAWVRTTHYWQDAAGRSSMQLNHELADRGLRIERTAILPDPLWPVDAPQPHPKIMDWLSDQQRHGIVVRLVRETDVAQEPGLLQDIGIYGDVAMGVQELDEQARTLRFKLFFAEATIRAAMTQWQRLSLFATPLPKIQP